MSVSFGSIEEGVLPPTMIDPELSVEKLDENIETASDMEDYIPFSPPWDNDVYAGDFLDSCLVEDDGLINTNENVDGLINTNENLDGLINTNENLDGLINTNENVDGLINTNENVDWLINTNENVDGLINTNENVDGLINTNENVDGLINTNENVDGLINTNENVDGLINTNENVDGLINTNENLDGIINTNENVDGLINTNENVDTGTSSLLQITRKDPGTVNEILTLTLPISVTPSATQERFQCKECPKSYKVEKAFKRHMLFGHLTCECSIPHSTGEVFVCKHCKFSTNCELVLEKHCELHKYTPIKCNECDYVYVGNWVKSFRDHNKSHGHGKPLKCNHCAFSSVNQRYFAKHLVRCKNSLYAISPNSLQTIQNGTLEYEKENVELYHQVINNEQFIKSVSLSTINSDPQTFPFDPLVHVANFSTEEPMLVSRSEKPKLKCQCESHSNMLYCEYCIFSTGCQRKMSSHERFHKGTPLVTCGICLYSFRSVSSLKIHAVIHSDERPFKCDFCDRDFKLKYCLYSHIRHCHKGKSTGHVKRPLSRAKQAKVLINSKKSLMQSKPCVGKVEKLPVSKEKEGASHSERKLRSKCKVLQSKQVQYTCNQVKPCSIVLNQLNLNKLQNQYHFDITPQCLVVDFNGKSSESDAKKPNCKTQSKIKSSDPASGVKNNPKEVNITKVSCNAVSLSESNIKPCSVSIIPLPQEIVSPISNASKSVNYNRSHLSDRFKPIFSSEESNQKKVNVKQLNLISLSEFNVKPCSVNIQPFPQETLNRKRISEKLEPIFSKAKKIILLDQNLSELKNSRQKENYNRRRLSDKLKPNFSSKQNNRKNLNVKQRSLISSSEFNVKPCSVNIEPFPQEILIRNRVSVKLKRIFLKVKKIKHLNQNNLSA